MQRQSVGLTAVSETHSAPDSGPQPAPLDFESTGRDDTWQDSIAWPVSHAAMHRDSLLLARNALDFLNETDAENRDAVTQCMAMFLNFGLPYFALAAALSREGKAGLRMEGTIPAVAYLRGEVDELPPDSNFEDAFLNPLPIDRPFKRRMARTASLNAGFALPKALIAPDAVAVTHNELLVEYAKRHAGSVGFHHVDLLFKKALAESSTPKAAEGDLQLADEMSRFVLRGVDLDPDILSRVLVLLSRKAARLLAVARQTLTAFRNMPSLPTELWSATGGHWAARALGLEVIRRGGIVRRFEHGSEAGMIDVVEPIALTELAVSTHFVLPTEAMQNNLAKTRARDLVSGYRNVTLEHAYGDPKIRALQSRKHKPGTGSKPRLLYGPTILTGFRALVPPLLPDPIHLDWQYRLVRQLQNMSIDLVLRPHPESYPLGQPHRLSTLAALDSRPYEDCIAGADVFLFDYEQSTTFYEALCTDRPVVLIDFGNALFTDEVRAMLEKRCRIVKASFDDRNRPQIDPKELEDAILSEQAFADGHEFRSLILGEVG